MVIYQHCIQNCNMWPQHYRAFLYIVYCVQSILAQNNFSEKWFDNTISENVENFGGNTDLLAAKNFQIQHKSKEIEWKPIDDSSNIPNVNSIFTAYTELKDDLISSDYILYANASPYLFHKHLIIAPGAKLIIEPGVTIAFAPRVGIHVQGTLLAKGTPTAHIVFTAQHNVQYKTKARTELTAIKHKLRLVDGPTPWIGRIQLFHGNAWRAVCTNSRNWTQMDYTVACKNLGLQGGRFWSWMEKTAGNQPRLLYEQPNCNGSEQTLFDCQWSSRQLGSGVCDYHSDIGIECSPLLVSEDASYWQGIYFDHAPSTKALASDNTVYLTKSLSSLQYVDIIGAGLGFNDTIWPAVTTLGVPPTIQNVSIMNSLAGGFNITRPFSGVRLHNITVENSGGIGVFINTSQGYIDLDGCVITNGESDGIKYVNYKFLIEDKNDRSSIYDFCTLPTTTGQTYPILLSFNQKYYAGSVKECGKYFFTKHGYRLTVKIEEFVLRNNETVLIEIFDGATNNERLLWSWRARNNTKPQTITSSKEKLYIKIRGEMREESNGFLTIYSGKSSAYDLRVKNSIIVNNAGRGIGIENMRSRIEIAKSLIMKSGHVAGLHVLGGVGDVNITESELSYNKGAGINITYVGGNRNISKSYITSNRGYGLAIWLNDTTDINHIEYIPSNQSTVIEYSQIYSNVDIGIRHGNFCSNHWINITGNMFNNSNDNDIHIDSCQQIKNGIEPTTKLQIGHNNFEYSLRNSIFISPVLNIQGRIEFNHFRYGTYGSIYLRNMFMDEPLKCMPVRLLVQHNYFNRNSGIYVVNLGLSLYCRKGIQTLLFTKNFVKDNKITESFGPIVDGSEGFDGAGRLNPRCRVAAAVVVGSNSVEIFRNILHNLDSNYEIGSQLSDQSQVINATYNWLGHTDEIKVYSRLFHRNDRYNLAKIEYIPYLLHNSNPGSTTVIAISTFVPRFHVEGSEYIGGEVDGQETIYAGTYTVKKDINIRPGGKLIIHPGVTLQFEPSVGMMVAGKLEARGRRPDDILLTLKRNTIIPLYLDSSTSVQNEMEESITVNTEEMLTVTESTDAPKIPVRLIGGAGPYEGRLQLFINGQWGTVCEYGWTELNAALVCNHLGYTLNPRDWRLLGSEMPNAGTSEDVIVSNVQCRAYDNNIIKCPAEYLWKNEFENSCTHKNDIGMRCYEGAWAGVRFSMLAERADLQYMTIEKAGLFDYTTNSFGPALQIDFARHNLENVRIVDNLDDGLGVIYADIYGGKSINNIKNSEFIGNRGNGISLKQLDFRIQGSVIKHNQGSGIMHNAMIESKDQLEIGGWFNMPFDSSLYEGAYNPYIIPYDNDNIELGEWESKYIRTEEIFDNNTTRKIHVRCPAGYVFGVQLLNPIPLQSTESILIQNARTENYNSEIWDVRRDLNIFPVASSSYGIIIHYESGYKAIGGTVLLLTTIPAPKQNIRNKVIGGPIPTLHIRSTKIQNNQRGITAFYYNRYFGNKGEYHLRKSNESIKILNTEISNNILDGIFLNSPHWDVINSNLSEITLHVNSSMITHNGYGLRHMSKDLRSSNNIFHYIVHDTIIENNDNGAFQVSLPYVWQYNENFTHSIYFGNNTWQNNRKFIIDVGGHYADLTISENLFLNNYCPHSLLFISGMEKRMLLDRNRFTMNTVTYIIELKIDSLSEKFGEVPALMEFNTLKHNENYYPDATINGQKSSNNTISTISSVVKVNGIQSIKLYRNLISNNKLRYNLVAGLKSAQLYNYFYATENWWGSRNIDYIESKIFDFDNWNNHADVIYQPYLIEDNFDSSISLIGNRDNEIDLSNWLGGRVSKNLMIKKRNKPYIIENDITVMPGVTLTIQHGVKMEFVSNVGILILGTLIAIGYRESPIILKAHSLNMNDEFNIIKKRSSKHWNMSIIQRPDPIRLCTNFQNCSVYTDSGLDINQGYLEYFNRTTLQWVPICDDRFTERNAQVVCRELGYNPLNAFYAHDRRIEYHINSLTRIWSWVQPFECYGDENFLSQCQERLNGQVYGHRHQCHWNDPFVFISCSGVPNVDVYWGGIRFANAEFESNQYEHRYHDVHTHGQQKQIPSQIEFVRIENAGILHNEKSAAILGIYKTPLVSAVAITNSANHGVNLISPNGAIHLSYLNISQTLGSGVNILSLTGEGRESDESSFTPLRKLDVPYNLFSMIDICDPQKTIVIEERVLLYYKYDNNPVNCVKIFNTAFRAKPIGFRFLQSNLFNHTKPYDRMDSIQLYDGNVYNSTILIAEINANTINHKQLFRTQGPSLSVHMIASGASEEHGFIAEVVTIPISTIGQSRDVMHNMSFSYISNSMKSALNYASAGELTPTLTLISNSFKNNCVQLFGNFSTCSSALHIDVQNMNSLYFMNNLLMENQGGLKIRADSRGSATSLRGFIRHNLFWRNRNRPSLYVEGRQSSPYQEVEIYRNYFAQNEAGFENVLFLKQIISNFSYNYIHCNIGSRIMEISGFEKVRLPIYQSTSHNGFYSNVATLWSERATVVAGTAGQQYVDNIFDNPENDYEIITVNSSSLITEYYNSTFDLWRSKIDARHNYWSYNSTVSVQSRIKDKSDDPLLLEVQVVPFQMNNRSILDGKCPPGWSLIHDTCYTYIGVPMTFYEAKSFCQSENATIPFLKTDPSVLWMYLQTQMSHLRYPDNVWIQDFNYIDRCTSFAYEDTMVENCEKRMSFICEIDPKVVIDPLFWRADIFAISILVAFLAAIILLIPIGICWYAKLKHRRNQRLQRRNSIRQSLRSLNSIDPQASLRRRNFHMSSSTTTLSKAIGADYKIMNNGSFESINKSILSSEVSFEPYENLKKSDGKSQYQPEQKALHLNEYTIDIPQSTTLSTLTNYTSTAKVATIGSASKASASRDRAIITAWAVQKPNEFELSFRNEGFRDNSTCPGTRNNSFSTAITEDTPIIYQTDAEETGSDYYGNSSTLPLRPDANENLAFLAEIKHSMPDDSNYPVISTSFLPKNTQRVQPTKKPNLENTPDYLSTEIRNRNTHNITDTNMEIGRPLSYLTAVGADRLSHNKMPSERNQTEYLANKRPKTLYEDSDTTIIIPPALEEHRQRSQSEVLLETDLDCEPNNKILVNANSRYHSQPLETSM